MIFRRYATLVVVFFTFLIGYGECLGENRGHPFEFDQDTLSYPNELRWEYGWDSHGHWVSHKRLPPPTYTLHCFVVAKSAASFFKHATFDPRQPRLAPEEYRRLTSQVLHAPLRRDSETRVTIPGYANLREFSQAQENLLKEECGGAWQSYFQRGHWRMIFPFSRGHQAKTASRLEAIAQEGKVAVIHVVRFPKLTINHACLLFGAERVGNKIGFLLYDPNNIDRPVRVTYDPAVRTFFMPANNYFPGGRIDVYQIWHNWLY